MIKKFRAFDGEEYWYADENLLFINEFKALEFRIAPIEMKDIEMSIGKADSNGVLIYENDLIRLISLTDKPIDSKLYQVVWSDDECGFRKVPHGLPFPETRIDEAFMEVIGTIHSQGEK